MNELKELKQQQKLAYEMGDFATFSAINKRIYELREQRIKQKELQRQKEIDDKIAKKIDEILTR